MTTYNNFTELQYHPWAVKERKYDAKIQHWEKRGYVTLLDIICDLCEGIHLEIWYSKQRKDYYKHVDRLNKKNI